MINAYETSGTSPTAPQWLTSREAANYLRVEPRTILMWARTRHIKGYVLSGTRRITWRFRRSDLDATLALPAVLSTTGGLE
jgi:excisionase family DNA binding protein